MDIYENSRKTVNQWLIIVGVSLVLIFCLCYFVVNIITSPDTNPTPGTLQQSDHPIGSSGLCRDGTYTSASHKQGACSSHGGVSIWWGP